MITYEELEKKAAELEAEMEKQKRKEFQEIMADLKRRGFDIPYEFEDVK